MLDRDPVDVVCDLLVDEALEASYVSAGGNLATLPKFVSHPLSMVGSDALLIGDYPSPRTYGCFPIILAEFVREERFLALPDAIRKTTSFPAQRLGLPDRGLLRDGFKADIVVFDAKRVKAPATRTEPKQFPIGIDYVIVNGHVVVDMAAGTPGCSPAAPSAAAGPRRSPDPRRQPFPRVPGDPEGPLTFPARRRVRAKLTKPSRPAGARRFRRQPRPRKYSDCCGASRPARGLPLPPAERAGPAGRGGPREREARATDEGGRHEAGLHVRGSAGGVGADQLAGRGPHRRRQAARLHAAVPARVAGAGRRADVPEPGGAAHPEPDPRPRLPLHLRAGRGVHPALRARPRAAAAQGRRLPGARLPRVRQRGGQAHPPLPALSRGVRGGASARPAR